MDNAHPHANFAASVFKNIDDARDVLSPLLPTEVRDAIDWQSLSVVDASFVDEKLKDYHSDLLFKAQDTSGEQMDNYILLEHKSHPDLGILKQLLAYQKEVYARQEKYAPVLPVVFYHGKERWNARTEFAKDAPHALSYYALNFRYVLISLRDTDLENLKFSLTATAIVHIFKEIWDIADLNKLRAYFALIAVLFSRTGTEDILKRILMYIYRVHDIQPVTVKEIIEVATTREGGIAMSTAELLEKQGIEKGREEGREEGRQEGIKKGLRRAVINLRSKGFPAQEVAEITGLTLDQIQQIEDEYE